MMIAISSKLYWMTLCNLRKAKKANVDLNAVTPLENRCHMEHRICIVPSELIYMVMEPD